MKQLLEFMVEHPVLWSLGALFWLALPVSIGVALGLVSINISNCP